VLEHQAAFDAVPVGNKKPVVIYIKNGTYKEKLHLDSGKNFVELLGESRFYTGQSAGMRDSVRQLRAVFFFRSRLTLPGG